MHTYVSTNRPAARADLYRFIHKAIRAAMCESLSAVSSMDVDDDDAVRDAASQVRDLLRLCRGHLEKEDRFVHPALEARAPGSSASIADDHRGHLDAFARLERLVAQVEDVGVPARDEAAHRLYLELARFVAGNFEHMHDEEIHANHALQSAYTDAEIDAIEGAIVGSLSPDERASALRWMLTAMNPRERSTFLARLRSRMPRPVFEGLLLDLRPRLAARTWQQIGAAIAA